MSHTAEFAAAIATGVTTFTIATLGVEPQALVVAAMGAGAGMAIAPGLGRWRAAITFISVISLCAVVGTAIASAYGGGNIARNATSGILAALFHPIVSVIVQRIPEAVDGFMRKLGLKQ